jgi:hypothetical protein
MTLGDVADVRAIAGWPSEEEVDDANIQEALDSSTRRIVTLTGMDESAWGTPPTDVNAALANETAEICAASMIVLRVSGTEKMVERHKELTIMCQNSMQLLNQAVSATVGDSPGFIDVNSEYTTYPLNPNVDPYDPLL